MSNTMSIVFTGRLVRVPVATETGAVMTVACNKHFTDGDGNAQERTEYLTVWLRNGMASNAVKYLEKGQFVSVVASGITAKTNEYEGKTTARLHVNGVISLEYGAKANGKATEQDAPAATDDSEEIPF